MHSSPPGSSVHGILQARILEWIAISFSKNFTYFVVINTVKGFGVVNKAEVDVFLELSCFFNDPTDVGHLISCSSAFSKSSLNIWKFLVHVLLKPHFENLSVRFQAKPVNITVIQVYAPTTNAEEAEVELFCEDLQDLLELTTRKDFLFIIGDWNAKVGSQETPGVTANLALDYRMKQGKG